MNTLFEWRLQDLERKADEALRIGHEVSSLRSDVARLECANRELRSENDGLRTELQATQDQVRQLMEVEV